MAPRHRVALGQRSPQDRRSRASELPRFDRWLKAVEEAVESRADLTVGPIAIDGLVLVESRKEEYVHHEVRTSGRVAVSCSCFPSRRGLPCFHRAIVAIRLWEDEMDVDLSAVPALALTNTLIGAYLEPPRERTGHPLRPGARPDAHPETTSPQAAPAHTPTYETVGGRVRAVLV